MPSVPYKFSGHQTFAFRYGWLEKGVQSIYQNSEIFSRDDALVHLGVGKNMVASIKHWCQVMRLIEQDPMRERNRGRYLRPTRIARDLLLSKSAWDQFMEDDASLWLVHWLLVSNPNLITTWRLMFSNFHRPDFTKREAVSFLVAVAERNSLKVKETVIARDVDCFLSTYVTGLSGKKNATPEEGYSCPFLELGLIQLTPDGELFRFAIGPKPTLPPAVFAYALDEYFKGARKGRQTLSVQECLYGQCSPGQAFKLDENSVIEYVEALDGLTEGALGLDETAGLKQIYRRDDVNPTLLMEAYYGRRTQ